MSDWWSKKLAGERPTTPKPALPPTEVPIRFPQSQQAPHPASGRTSRSDNSPPPENFTEALQRGLTNGGEAARKEDRSCPDCGSSYVFTRTGKGQGTSVNGASPAPRCYECGWNGMYDQASQGSWIS